MRIDRLLLTIDTTYIPVDIGPVETERLTGTTGVELTIDRTIVYDYDNLYRLTGANYSTGQRQFHFKQTQPNDASLTPFAEWWPVDHQIVQRRSPRAEAQG